MAKSKSYNPVQPTRGTMDRVVKAVRQVERAPVNAPARRRQVPVIHYGAGLVPAQAGSGGIAAGDMGTPSSADVTLCELDESTGGLTATGDTVGAKNLYTTAVPADALVWLVRWRKAYYVVNGNCGASE